MTEDKKKAEKADRRYPLATVVFRIPVEVETAKGVIRGFRMDAGEIPPQYKYPCPAITYDPDTGLIHIGNSMYPSDGTLVQRMVRARASKGDKGI